MYSMGNKNKKKGYKQALAAPSSQKIIFGESSTPADPELPTDQPTILPPTPRRQETESGFFPRLIPPSEKEDLPRNMFVTSVDVEEGMWGKKNKKKKRQSEPVQAEWVAPVLEQEIGPAYDDYGDIELDYGTGEGGAGDASRDDKVGLLDEALWADAEARFEALPLVTVFSSLGPGALVAWKVGVTCFSLRMLF